MKKETKIVKGYHDSGNLYYECPYVNGIPRGIEEVWYDGSGRLALYTYMDDEYNGVVVYFNYSF